ncbi:rhodanese-like domain-containing protein [Robbsia sp. Bb-Pol-6]|uniref:Rhodanese-like domain-containing protein n=1 Tax=Robbsia betulipollinis TaxID=2981849 RepID=A0ABT3ZIM1_9BURK|nr:rhodanese-like domain-containing protein [Robbsia betulipollinis]MCY0386384.1 rhodanese-like domain-containing protein [Robbsia betulipollinis]
MTTVDHLLATAAQRAADDALPYAGALTPAETFAFLEQVPEARLIDLRTRAELDWVGRPLVAASQYAHIEWIDYPAGARNPHFLAALRDIAAAHTPMLLLCRSAARSKAAAALAAQEGFTAAFDVLEGFEGGKDAQGHRKSVAGWCYRGLPWIGA